jgi:hypothetical protein
MRCSKPFERDKQERPMAAALRAGIFYFAIVFMLGFALGTVRVLLIVPRFGETNAVLLELPVMMAFSWIACARLARRFAVPPGIAERLAMGGIAFALLMLGELGVSVWAFGRTVAEHVASFQTTSARLGLAAQIAFALFPVLHVYLGSPVRD